MARGPNPETFGHLGGSGRTTPNCPPDDPATPLAAFVLEKCGIPNSTGILGHPMPGYDIRSQEALSILRLSLLALTDGSRFYEIYCRGDGTAVLVEIGAGGIVDGTVVSESYGVDVQERIDHIVIKARENLPTRYLKEGINVMGGGIQVFTTADPCQVLGPSTKDDMLGSEAFAVFKSSFNCPEMQAELCRLVDRQNQENLVGYKVTFADIPRHASIAPSQTTPYNSTFPPTTQGYINFTIGTGYECEGGVADVSNVNVVGASVLDIARGSDLANSQYGSLLAADPFFGSTPDDFYVLLDHQCGMNALSRGQHWKLFGNIDTGQASISLFPGTVSAMSELAFVNEEANTRFLRRKTGHVSSLSDAIELSIMNGEEISLASPFQNDFIEMANNHGVILSSFGGFGFEATQMVVSFTVLTPSIQVRSMYNDAVAIAQSVSDFGVFYHPIVIQELQNPIVVDGDQVNFPLPPQDCGVGEFDMFCPDTILDTLEGTVIDFGAPWASISEAQSLSRTLKETINSDTGVRLSKSFVGAMDILPGYTLDGNVINFVEIVYADKDSITTNVTTGPKYYQTGSYSDSKYVKSSETAQRRARVLGGDSTTGLYLVDVDGFGIYTAVNGLLDPIFPGDRVDVKIFNVPIEV